MSSVNAVCKTASDIGEDFYHSHLFQVIFPTFTNDLRFYVQNATLPTFSMSPVSGYTTLFNATSTKIPGDSLEYGQVTFNFLLDADLSGYTAILSWMKGISSPESFEQFKKFIVKDVGTELKTVSTSHNTATNANYLDLVHPIVVLLQNQKGQTICKYTFVNSFPVSLDGFTLDTKVQDNTPLTFNVTFNYAWVDFENFLQGC